MSGLAEFLLARIAEDEEIARAGQGLIPTGLKPWALDWGPGNEEDASIEITPARILAECEAKRRIVEEHAAAGGLCDVCAEYDGAELMPKRFPCPTLRLLALPYADRPGFRQEWAVQ